MTAPRCIRTCFLGGVGKGGRHWVSRCAWWRAAAQALLTWYSYTGFLCFEKIARVSDGLIILRKNKVSFHILLLLVGTFEQKQNITAKSVLAMQLSTCCGSVAPFDLNDV